MNPYLKGLDSVQTLACDFVKMGVLFKNALSTLKLSPIKGFVFRVKINIEWPAFSISYLERSHCWKDVL